MTTRCSATTEPAARRSLATLGDRSDKPAPERVGGEVSFSTAAAPTKVAVIYHFFPHYRAPVLRALARSQRYAFEFWGAKVPFEGIRVFSGDDVVEIRQIETCKTPRGFKLARFWAPVVDARTKAVIVIGNPNILQTWFIALLARLLGKRVLFWTHGWLKPEPKVKAMLRNLYFALGHRTLVYADRAIGLAARSGFPAHKVRPIYNSLDWELADRLYQEAMRTSAPSSGGPGAPLKFICAARLIKNCRFDLLLEAMALMGARGVRDQLTLIGDGPERAALEAQAKTSQLDVRFLGEIYDEAVLCGLFCDADLTVSPGKVGLAAVHSMSYGTPVVTHGDLDQQMPEVELVEPKRTGDFFAAGDAASLARVLCEAREWLGDRDIVRARCREAVRARYTPDAQRQLIEAALDEVMT